MEKSIYDFSFQEILPLDASFLKERTFIWILHANKIPPHIGFSIDGLYFSLKSNGKDEEVPVNKVLEVLKKSKIQSVFVEIEDCITKSDVATIFDFLQSASSEMTCLFPLKKLWDVPENVIKIADLLRFLERNKKLRKVFGLHLEKDFEGIPYYTMEQIKSRIEFLNHVKGKKHLPESR